MDEDIPLEKEETTDLNHQIESMKKEMTLLKDKIKQQNNYINDLRATIDSLREGHDIKFGSLFNDDQIRALVSDAGGKGHRWTDKTILDSLQVLYMVGTRGYLYLRHDKKQPWPSKSVLLRRIQGLKINEGLLIEILPFLRARASIMNSYDKHCGIAFDEMAIVPGRRYDQCSDSFIGSDREDKALVFTLRGVTQNWKQIIAYCFNCSGGNQGSFLKDIIFNIISKVEETGIEVDFITSDMGCNNKQLWNELGITADKNFFQHPLNPNRKIYVFADAQHLLKNLTQALVNHKTMSISETMKIQHNLPTTEINLKYIEELFVIEENNIFKLAPKLEQHMFHPTTKQKMRVKNSQRIMSNQVSSALRLLAENDNSMINAITTAWFIEQVYHWHDLITSTDRKMAFSLSDQSKYENETAFMKNCIEIILYQ